MPETPVNTDAESLKDVEAVAAALLTADDGGNAEAILSATAHAGDCPFVAFPRAYTCSKCQGDHYRMLARAALDSCDAALREAREERDRLHAKLADERQHHARQGLDASTAEFKGRWALVDTTKRWAAAPSAWDKDGEPRDFRQIRFAVEALLARSQLATPSPVPTFPPEVNTCLDALQTGGSSVRFDDHEVGQPSPETAFLEAIARELAGMAPRMDPAKEAELEGRIYAALYTIEARGYVEGERAGLERAAQECKPEPGEAWTRSSIWAGELIEDRIRALLPPSTPETKPDQE